MACKSRSPRGVSLIEAALIIPIIMLLGVATFDLGRMAYFRTIMTQRMTAIIKEAEGNQSLEADIWKESASSALALEFTEARKAILEKGMSALSKFPGSRSLNFQQASHLDAFASGVKPSSNTSFALLFPGFTVKLVDGSLVTHTHKCLPIITNSGGSIESKDKGSNGEEFLILAGSSKSTKECAGDKRVNPDNESDFLPELLKREPVEVYAKAFVKTFLFGTQTIELRVPGYVNSSLKLTAKPVPTPEPCSVNGIPYPNGLTFTRYQAASVTCSPCKSEVRRCVDGKLSGSYTATSCSSLPCKRVTPPKTPNKKTKVNKVPDKTKKPEKKDDDKNCVYKVTLDEVNAGKKILSGKAPRCIVDRVNKLSSSRTIKGKFGDDDIVREIRMIGVNFYYPGCDPSTPGNTCPEFVDNKSISEIYLNNDCEGVGKPIKNSAKLCGSSSLRYTQSPISLIFNPSFDINKAFTVTSFPLGGANTAPGSIYQWRASAEAPLLVFDKEAPGVVTSAAELFGSHTFGKEWNNGYEALASLDLDGDKKLSQGELLHLALWFDENRNGISEIGEIKSLEESGVTAIFTEFDTVDPETGFFHASLGFERTVLGKVTTLPSVDWLGKEYVSSSDAFVDSMNDLTEEDQAPTEPPPVSKENLVKGALSVSGHWVWSMEGEKEAAGVLSIYDNDGEIQGVSLVELPVDSNSDGVARVVRSTLLKGVKVKEENNKLVINFSMRDRTGAASISTAEISPDGNTLFGHTSMEQKASDSSTGNFQYKWTAKKL